MRFLLSSLTKPKYGLSFYMQYLAHWPEYFQVAESPSGEIMGYSKLLISVNLQDSKWNEWVCPSCNFSDLCLGGAQFESQP